VKEYEGKLQWPWHSRPSPDILQRRRQVNYPSPLIMPKAFFVDPSLLLKTYISTFAILFSTSLPSLQVEHNSPTPSTHRIHAQPDHLLHTHQSTNTVSSLKSLPRRLAAHNPSSFSRCPPNSAAWCIRSSHRQPSIMATMSPAARAGPSKTRTRNRATLCLSAKVSPSRSDVHGLPSARLPLVDTAAPVSELLATLTDKKACGDSKILINVAAEMIKWVKTAPRSVAYPYAVES
jgi:hypothetical protein